MEDLEVDYMEQQVIALADVLLSPSAYLLSWMHKEGWQLPQEHRVRIQPYIIPSAARKTLTELSNINRRGGSEQAKNGEHLTSSASHSPTQVKELVFFGRLEVRKGIVLFCDAIDELVMKQQADGAAADDGNDEPLLVTFLGSARNTVHGVNGGEYARTRARAWGKSVKVS